MRVGVLTGGGDCPGLNAVLRALVRQGLAEGGVAGGVEDGTAGGIEFLGIRRGWKGLIEDDTVALGRADTDGLLAQGGTLLGTSRTNPYRDGGSLERLKATVVRHGLDGVVAIGGEDTLGVAARLGEDGVGVVGVPKTIDNDLSGTDVTFGFDTAVQTAVEAIDRLHTTAASHGRAMVVEVMGRHAGWIALHAGVAGGADVVLVPERRYDLVALIEQVRARVASAGYAIVVASEGATEGGGDEWTASGGLDEFGHVRLGGIGGILASELSIAGIESRSVVLGHLLRGGTPTAADRLLATRFGLEAGRAVAEGDWGTMVAASGTEVVRVALSDAVATLKTVPEAVLDSYGALLGSCWV